MWQKPVKFVCVIVNNLLNIYINVLFASSSTATQYVNILNACFVKLYTKAVYYLSIYIYPTKDKNTSKKEINWILVHCTSYGNSIT